MSLIRAAPHSDHGLHRRTQSLQIGERSAGLRLHGSFNSTKSEPTGATVLPALNKGDCLQVFSRTAQRWIPGKVEDVKLPGDNVVVAFAVGGEECKKTLPRWSPNLRLPQLSGGASTRASETSMVDVTSSGSVGLHSLDDVCDPPKALYVSIPTNPECSGLYEIDVAMGCEAHHPVWVFHGSAGPRWMYFGNDDAWHIGDTDEQELQFQCCSGFAHAGPVHKGEHPDQIPQDAWYSDKKGRWHLDPTIQVISLDALGNSIKHALESGSDKDVLQIIQRALTAGVPIACLDTIFPMFIYVHSTQNDDALSGNFDLVTSGDLSHGFVWQRKSGQNTHCLFRDSDNPVGGSTLWKIGPEGDMDKKPKLGFMKSMVKCVLPDQAEVTKFARAQQWYETQGRGWTPHRGIVTSQMRARLGLREAIDNGDFERLRAAVMVGKVAQLQKQELSAGEQAMGKVFQKEKELTIFSMASRGVSLRQMLKFYQSQVQTHLGEPDATTHDVVIQMVTQYTKEKCMSLAEQLNGMDTKECPKHHIVHSWSMKHVDMLKGLVYFVTKYRSKSLNIDDVVDALSKSGIDSKVLDERFFFCGYCVNQHISCDEVTEDYLQPDHPRCETNVFEEVAQRIHDGGGNMIVTLDEDFQLLKRIWCLDEIHEALERGMQLEFTTSKIAKLEEKHFADVRECGARIEADKQRILKKIQDGIGFDAFNRKVKDAIKERVEYMRHQASMDPLHGDHDGPLTRISRLETDHKALKGEHQALKVDHEALKQDFTSLRQEHEGLLSLMALQDKRP